MPKVKISEYSATANSNTDVASINIDEGCAPSGINNAIRAVMGHLKDFQQGTNGDPFNGPVNGTLGATTPSTANVTTLTTSSTVTHNGGTANGVAYLNGSKVLTTGSALVFDGTNLGVGVNPAQTLHVKTSTAATPITLGVLSNSTTLPALSFNGAYASSTMAGTYCLTGSLYTTVPSGAAHYYAVADSIKATLDASGNLGIGTSTPSTYGRVVSSGGTFALVTDTASQRRLSFWSTSNGNSENAYIQVQNDGATTNTGEILFATKNSSGTLAERARIDSSGNLLVGGTSKLAGGLSGLDLNSAGATGISFAKSATPKGYFYITSDTASFIWSTASGTVASVVSSTNGVTLTNGATSWASLSDERKKDIIEPIVDAATKVSSLRSVIGKYKTEEDGIRRAMLIAQDVQAVLPEAVTENADGDLLLQYTEVIPLLVAAIKEQQALITQLTARITALESA